MLRTNLWPKAGLNGTRGTVKGIIYAEGTTASDLPEAVLVEFKEYQGDAFIPSQPKIIPIPVVKREFDSSC